MGGRGGASGMSGKAATGGRSGNITVKDYVNDGPRMIKVTSFSGNDGMVQELAFGTIEPGAPKQSKLDATKYDFVIATDPNIAWGPGHTYYYNGDIHSNLAIGVKIAPIQAVSEKQRNYAKDVLERHLKENIENGFVNAYWGETTIDKVIQKIKKMPKQSARDLLDKNTRGELTIHSFEWN